jgi:CHASE2 domain-containing sensor protein
VTALLIGIFTGALGVAYIAYGRRQTKFVPLLSGVALCSYSYFVDGWLWLCVVGALLAVAPFVFDY